MHAAHAAAARYRAVGITSVGSYVFALSQALLLLHGYGFCNAFGFVREVFCAKQSTVDSSQLPPYMHVIV